MSVSIVGAIFIGFGVYGWLLNQRVFTIALSASAALVTTAAVSVGGNSVPPFFVLAALAAVRSIVDFARGGRFSHRSFLLLSALVGWSAIITGVGPLLFGGIPVLDPRAGIDQQIADPMPLAYTASMAAQLGYLILGVGVVAYLGSRNTLSPALLSPAIAVGTILSAARLIPGSATPIDLLFRNYESAAYNAYEERHFGVFAEPSYLAVFSVTAIAYCAYRLPLARGWRRFGIAIIGLLALLNLLASASGTAALSVVLLVAIAGAYYAWRYLLKDGAWRLLFTRSGVGSANRRGIRVTIVVIVIAGLIVLIIPNPLSQALVGTIVEKIGTQSFANRTAADWFSIQLLVNTYGMGVGLGANRPSSFLTLVLSSVGVIGAALLFAAIVIALWRARARRAWQPVVVALIALVVAKSVAEPALSTPLLWLCLGACVYVGRDTHKSPRPFAGPIFVH